MEILQQICNIIILIGGAVGAVVAISTLIGKPLKFIKKRHEKAEAIRREELAKDVEQKLAPRFDEISRQNLEQERIIAILEKSTRDILRKEIIHTYHKYKGVKQLTDTMRDYLDDLYKDYKAQNGNHYIDKIYARMCTWEVIPDDE